MKKHLFFLFIAAAAVMGTTVSCTKDDNVLPEVIDSEIIESGAGNVNATTGFGGTTLSYESWFKVNLTTRGAGDQTVTAQVNADMLVQAREIKVSNFEPVRQEMSVSYRAGESVQQSRYVTVIDSVMVCGLAFGECNFNFQVPVYDDGISHEVMPYHRFKNVSAGASALTDMDNATIRGVEYERKMFQQQVRAEFADEVYVANCCFVLLKKVSGDEVIPEEPYQVSTDILDGGLEQDGGSYYTWLKVRQNWSDGSAKEITCHTTLRGEGESTVMPYQVVNSANAQIVSTRWLEGRKTPSGGYETSEYVIVYDQQYLCEIEYSLFIAQAEFRGEIAYYTDEVVTYPMPALAFSNVTVKNPELRFIGPDHSEQEGDFVSWWLTQNVTAKYGHHPVEAKVEGQLVVK